MGGASTPLLSPFSETVRKRGVEKERPEPLRKLCSPGSLLLLALPTSPLPTHPSVRPSGVRKVATVDALTEEEVEPGRRLRRRRPSVLVVEGATVGEVHHESTERATVSVASLLSSDGPAAP